MKIKTAKLMIKDIQNVVLSSSEYGNPRKVRSEQLPGFSKQYVVEFETSDVFNKEECKNFQQNNLLLSTLVSENLMIN